MKHMLLGIAMMLLGMCEVNWFRPDEGDLMVVCGFALCVYEILKDHKEWFQWRIDK